jgi:hypothetical protein
MTIMYKSGRRVWGDRNCTRVEGAGGGDGGEVKMLYSTREEG